MGQVVTSTTYLPYCRYVPFLSDKTWVDFASTNKKASLALTLAYVSIIICGVILGLVHTVS